MNKKDVKNAIEAILFMSGQPVKFSELKSLLKVKPEELEQAVNELQQDLANRGIVITKTADSVQMGTSPELADVVNKFIQDKLREKLTDASLETLSIIAYKQPVSRAQIEAIRGVNCQYILKLLMQRGLIEKTNLGGGDADGRVSYYQITHEFLNQLGITSINELPDFEETAHKLEADETM